MLIWPKREFLIKSLFNNVSQIYLVKSYCGIIMDTPIVILNYKTYLESSGINALELAHDLESAANESGITMVAAPQAADIYRISEETSLPIFAQHIDPISP